MTVVVSGEAHPWIGRSRRGYEHLASTRDWERHAKCVGDDRFIQRDLKTSVIDELIAICHTCPVMIRCRQWAEAQTQPVGFAVAGGRRWKAWNFCAICGKKVRGVDRCAKHIDDEPIGTITAEGEGRAYRHSDGK